MRVLLTGANGFVGGHLYTLLKSKGHEVRALTRIADARYGNDNIACDLERTENLDSIVVGCDAIIHLAGRAHVMGDGKLDASAAYESANTDVTRRLAECAANNGIRRFVFLSSIKVNGESTPNNKPFTSKDAPPSTRSIRHFKTSRRTGVAASCEFDSDRLRDHSHPACLRLRRAGKLCIADKTFHQRDAHSTWWRSKQTKSHFGAEPLLCLVSGCVH